MLVYDLLSCTAWRRTHRQEPVSVWDRATLASLFAIAEDVDMAREEIVLA